MLCLPEPPSLYPEVHEDAWPYRLNTRPTYDLASPVLVMKAVDWAMRHYFGTSDWLAAWRRDQPGT